MEFNDNGRCSTRKHLALVFTASCIFWALGPVSRGVINLKETAVAYFDTMLVVEVVYWRRIIAEISQCRCFTAWYSVSATGFLFAERFLHFKGVFLQAISFWVCSSSRKILVCECCDPRVSFSRMYSILISRNQIGSIYSVADHGAHWCPNPRVPPTKKESIKEHSLGVLWRLQHREEAYRAFLPLRAWNQAWRVRATTCGESQRWGKGFKSLDVLVLFLPWRFPSKTGFPVGVWKVAG